MPETLYSPAILISGANGYIGRALTRALILQNYNVHWLARRFVSTPEQVKLHIGTDTKALNKLFAENKFETVIHLAALWTSDSSPEAMPDQLEANFALGARILASMTRYGCHQLINTSTFWEELSAEKPIPNSLYATLKKAFRELIDYFSEHQNLKAISLRLFDVYGPGDTRKKIFNLLTDAVQRGESSFAVTEGHQLMYWTHIDDVVEAYIQALGLIASASQKSHARYDIRGEARSLRETLGLFKDQKCYNIDLAFGSLPYRPGQIMKPVVGKVLPNWEVRRRLESSLKDI